MNSAEATVLAPALRRTLCQVARDSIEQGLRASQPLTVVASGYHPELQQIRASFVTLYHRDQLRGCIGRLEASRPLVSDVAANAFAAAFQDPRFSPLQQREWPDCVLQLSLLSIPEPIHFRDQEDLLAQLRPGEDGLILQHGPHRGTFLPAVWESLPEPGEFLLQLKRKAGLPGGYWSEQIEVLRYHSESFAETDIT